MNDFKADMTRRTKEFALRVLRMCSSSLKENYERVHVGHQLFRCATSVAANFRAACHAKSSADFLQKMKICEEEADEACFWIDFAVSAKFISEPMAAPLVAEAHEIACIISATCKTSRLNLQNRRKN